MVSFILNASIIRYLEKEKNNEKTKCLYLSGKEDLKMKEAKTKRTLKHWITVALIPAVMFTIAFVFNMWILSIPWYIRDIGLWVNAVLTMVGTGVVCGIISYQVEDVSGEIQDLFRPYKACLLLDHSNLGK